MTQAFWTGWDSAIVALAVQATQTAADDGSDVWEGWGSVILVVSVVVLVAAIVALLLWQGMKTAQTRIASRTAIAQDESYRALAAETTAAQQKLAEETERVARELAEMRTRLTAIEKLLSEVG